MISTYRTLGALARTLLILQVGLFVSGGLATSTARASEDAAAEDAAPMPETAPPSPESVTPGFYVTPERFEITPPGHIEPLFFLGLFAVDAGVGPDSVTGFDGGFDVTDSRLALGGQLEQGFGYFIQADLFRSTVLLDLLLDWKHRDSGFRAGAGYFRTPFSGELQIGVPFLDFIKRSQIVRALAPGRQIGIQLDQELAGDAAILRGGVFNGNGFNTNDDERLLYMLRLDGTLGGECGESICGPGAVPASEWKYGFSVAYSEDDDARLGLGLADDFAGKRLLGGADLRWTRGDVFLSAEGIYGRIARRGPGGGRDVFGYQASVGWRATRMVQVLLRYDALWAGSLTSDRDLAIASLVLTFSKYVSIQNELRVPVRGQEPTPGGVVNLTFQF